MEKLFTLHIVIESSNDVKGLDCTIALLGFSGRAEGEFFNGVVLPGGVDTQRILPDGSGTLSARYILEGTDIKGKKCRIYVLNEAALGGIKTTPTFVTDSEALVEIFKSPIEGKMVFAENDFQIEFWKL